MKKTILLSVAALIFPLYVLVVLMNSILPHVYYTSILVHTLLMVVECSMALSICFFFYMHFVNTKHLLFFVIMLFFEILGITLFFHAITVPSFYFLDEYIFEVTEHYGILFSSIILLLLFIKSRFLEDFFYVHKRTISLCTAFALLGWFIALTFLPAMSLAFYTYINHALFFSSVFLVLGIYALLKKSAVLNCYAFFPYLVAGLCMLISTAIIPFFHKEWNIVGWYFHIVIILPEIIIFLGILKKCDKKCDI